MIELTPDQTISLQKVLQMLGERCVAFNQSGVMQTLEICDLAHVCLCDIKPDGEVIQWHSQKEV